jgi:Flp pilus assembly pilin Flp
LEASEERVGSLAIIAVVNGLGSNLNTRFTSINTSLK